MLLGFQRHCLLLTIFFETTLFFLPETAGTYQAATYPAHTIKDVYFLVN